MILTNDFRVVKVPKKKTVKEWKYSVQRRYTIYVFSWWKEIDYEGNETEAYRSARWRIERAEQLRKSRKRKSKTIWTSDKNTALLNARSDNDQLKQLSDMILKGKEQ